MSDIPSILIVDDTVANQLVLCDLVKDLGYRTRSALNGRSAITAVETEIPDLVLLDIMMPGLNGFETLAQMRVCPGMENVPVIFISALSELSEKMTAFRAGAVDYITKPFQIEEVQSRLTTHLMLQKMRRELAAQNERLAERVAQQTEKLTKANTQLENIAIVKAEFINLISHELRTPLTGLFSLFEIIVSKIQNIEEQDEYRGLYQAATGRIKSFLDDAIQIDSLVKKNIESNKEVCNLCKAVSDMVEAVGPIADTRNVSFATRATIIECITGSNELVSRALRAIFETAARCSSPNSIVHIDKLGAEPGFVTLCITFDCVEMSPNEREHFFDLFGPHQVIPSGGNVGLSPAIAQSIVVLLGGKISVDSVSNIGARIVVSFPK